FPHPNAVSPWDRAAGNGVRLVRYLDPGDPGVLARPLEVSKRDFAVEKPVGDAIFEIYRRQFLFDPRPLDARIEAVDSTSPDWIRQRVSFTAAYGGERAEA